VPHIDSDTAPAQERLNLLITCTAQFLTLAGMSAVLPLIPLYLQEIGVVERTALKYWTGAIASAPFAVAVVATPLWAALADRTGYKPMVVRSVAGIAVATVGMGLVGSPLALLLWRGVQGAVSGVFPASVALVSALTPEARLGRALALLQTARSAGALCGPVIGGVLADLVGIRGLFFGVAAIAAATAVACSVGLVEAREARAHTAGRSTPASMRDLLAARPLLAMFALVLGFQAAAMCSWPTLALFVEQFGVARDAVASTTGVVALAAGLPATLTATVWARLGQRHGVLRMLAASLLFSGLANVAVGTVHSLSLVLVMRAVAGLAMAGFIPLAFEWMNAHAPPGTRARAAGLASTAMMAGNVIGPLAGGWLAAWVGLPATFWAPGVLLIGAGAVVGVSGVKR
jgi:DHA1 family multidrug resistance protein-like MFS transporter